MYIFSVKPEPIDLNVCQKKTYLSKTLKFVFTLFSGAHWTNITKQENPFSYEIMKKINSS